MHRLHAARSHRYTCIIYIYIYTHRYYTRDSCCVATHGSAGRRIKSAADRPFPARLIRSKRFSNRRQVCNCYVKGGLSLFQAANLFSSFFFPFLFLKQFSQQDILLEQFSFRFVAFAEFGSFVSARISKPFAIKYMLLGLTRYAIGGCGQIAVGGRDGSTRMTDDVMYPFSIRIPCEYFNFCRRAVNGKCNCEQPSRNFNWAHSSTFYPFVPCFLPRGKTTIVLGRSVGLHRPCFHAVTGFVIMRTPYAITDPFRSPSRYELCRSTFPKRFSTLYIFPRDRMS